MSKYWHTSKVTFTTQHTHHTVLALYMFTVKLTTGTRYRPIVYYLCSKELNTLNLNVASLYVSHFF